MKGKNAAELTLSKTKIRLMMDPSTVFYATILFSLKTVFVDDTHQVKTAAVDGTHLFLNVNFFLKLSDEERLGLVAHEVLHVALSHMTRRGTRDPKTFNIAGDHVINLALLNAGFKLPANGLCDPKYKDRNTEQVYSAIFKEKPSLPDYEEDVIYAPDATQQDVASHISNIVMRAQIQAKQAGIGNLPAEIDIVLQKNINPKLPWHQILANYLSEFAADDYTMRRLNRKYFPDFYLPTLYSEAICDLAIAVDSSGSVSTFEFSYFIHEIDLIRKAMNPKKMSIIDFDTRIKKIHDVDETVNVLTDIKFSGRGGTNILPVMEWAAKNKPEVLLIFSDGEFHLPNSYPAVPLVWLIHGSQSFNPKSGRVIRYEIEEK